MNYTPEQFRKYIIIHWMVACNQDIRNRFFPGTNQRMGYRKHWLPEMLAMITENITILKNARFSEKDKKVEDRIIGGIFEKANGIWYSSKNLKYWTKSNLSKPQKKPKKEWDENRFNNYPIKWLHETVRNNFNKLYNKVNGMKGNIDPSDKNLTSIELLKYWEQNGSIDLRAFKGKQDDISGKMIKGATIKLDGEMPWMGYVQISEKVVEENFLVIMLERSFAEKYTLKDEVRGEAITNMVMDQESGIEVNKFPVTCLPWIEETDCVKKLQNWENKSLDVLFPLLEEFNETKELKGITSKKEVGIRFYDGSLKGRKGRFCFVVVPKSNSQEEFLEALQFEIKLHRAMIVRHKPDWIVLCSSDTFDEAQAIKVLKKVLKDLELKGVLFLDNDSLIALLSRNPWVWSQYLSRKSDIRIFKGNNQPILEDLFLTDLSAEEFEKVKVKRYISGRQGFGTLFVPPNIEIIGNSGMGCRSAIYQFIKDHFKEATIIYIQRLTDQDNELMKLFLKDIPDEYVIILKDIDKDLGTSYNQSSIGKLEALTNYLDSKRRTNSDKESKRINKLRINKIVTYSHEKRAKVEDEYGRYFSDNKFEILDLHDELQLFHPQLVSNLFDSIRIKLDSEERDLYVQWALEQKITVKNLVDFCINRERIPKTQEAQEMLNEFWNFRFMDLLNEDRIHESAILKLLSIFHQVKIFEISSDILHGIFGSLFPDADSDTFKAALNDLEEMKWLDRTSDGIIYVGKEKVNPYNVGVPGELDLAHTLQPIGSSKSKIHRRTPINAVEISKYLFAICTAVWNGIDQLGMEACKRIYDYVLRFFAKQKNYSDAEELIDQLAKLCGSKEDILEISLGYINHLIKPDAVDRALRLACKYPDLEYLFGWVLPQSKGKIIEVWKRISKHVIDQRKKENWMAVYMEFCTLNYGEKAAKIELRDLLREFPKDDVLAKTREKILKKDE
ncbi:MAG TPA: hypothetical protein PK014_05650 [Thermoanaerobaculia bacterium]|nr:hypothetical protein [Thermoanaerobaculia bacterium]HUM29580.1 hypothetical protein [Thermoanaerobaculia bacterium]HXK67231.1 hypothetical protein [Thermoanaerobaculia bacterium]